MRSIFFALLAIVLTGVTVLSQNKTTRSEPGEIKSIILDQRELVHRCRPGTEGCGGPPPTSFLVNVQLEVFHPSKITKYQYSVSAGKITGQGTSVVWDLTNTPPGSYTIRAQAVKNGKSLDECYPVPVDTTIENADLLSSRISFIRRELLMTDDN